MNKFKLDQSMKSYYFVRIIAIFSNYIVLFLGSVILADENFQIIFGYLAAFQLVFIKFHETSENFVLSAQNCNSFRNRLHEVNSLTIVLIIFAIPLVSIFLTGKVLQFLAFSTVFVILLRPFCILRYKKSLIVPTLSMQLLPQIYVSVLILSVGSRFSDFINDVILFCMLIICLGLAGHKAIISSIIRLRQVKIPTINLLTYIGITYVISSWFATDILIASFVLSASDFVHFRISVGLAMISLLVRQFMSYEFFSKNIVDMHRYYNDYRWFSVWSSAIILLITYMVLYGLSYIEILREYELSSIMQIFVLLSVGALAFSSLGPFYAYASKLGRAGLSFLIFVGAYLAKGALLIAFSLFSITLNGSLYTFIGSIVLVVTCVLHNLIVFRHAKST